MIDLWMHTVYDKNVAQSSELVLLVDPEFAKFRYQTVVMDASMHTALTTYLWGR